MPNKGTCWRKGLKKEKSKKTYAISLTRKEADKMTAGSIDDSLDSLFGKKERSQFNPSWKKAK